MGTRADFYVRQEDGLKWLGSIAWDGYPSGIEDEVNLKAKTDEEWQKSVDEMLSKRDDGTKPEQGWPWPWNNSCTTNYTYIFQDGKVEASCFGHSLFDPLDEPEERPDERVADGFFPDMSHLKKMAAAGSERSGIMMFTAK